MWSVSSFITQPSRVTSWPADPRRRRAPCARAARAAVIANIVKGLDACQLLAATKSRQEYHDDGVVSVDPKSRRRQNKSPSNVVAARIIRRIKQTRLPSPRRGLRQPIRTSSCPLELVTERCMPWTPRTLAAGGAALPAGIVSTRRTSARYRRAARLRRRSAASIIVR